MRLPWCSYCGGHRGPLVRDLRSYMPHGMAKKTLNFMAFMYRICFDANNGFRKIKMFKLYHIGDFN